MVTKVRKAKASKAKPKDPSAKRPRNSTNQTPERARKLLQLVDESIAQSGIVRQAERELACAKEAAKEAKDWLDLQWTKLNGIVVEMEMVRDGKPLQQKLPLDAEHKPGTNGKPVPLVALGLTNRQIEIFGEHDVTNVTQFEALIRDGKFTPGAIKGLGQAAIDKITDKYTARRAANPIEAKEEPEKAAVDEKAQGNGQATDGVEKAEKADEGTAKTEAAAE
jgi:hypothetical protein